MVVYKGKLTLWDSHHCREVVIEFKDNEIPPVKDGTKLQNKSRNDPEITGSSGHYYTYRNSRKSNFEFFLIRIGYNEWVGLNDEVVRNKISWEDIEDCNAKILFYERVRG